MGKTDPFRRCFILLAAVTAAASLRAELSPQSQEMNRPFPPFHLIANVYYVGASDVTSYLITTPRGHILLDCGFPETIPQIRANVARLGISLKDIRILLVTHPHIDHAGGMAELKRETGAKLYVGAVDAPLMEAGGKGDFQWRDEIAYPPAVVDHRVRDGEAVALGGTRMVAHLTPGHTKGCLTWTMTVTEGGRPCRLVFLGGVSSPGYRLAGNLKYPGIVADFRRTFATLKKLPCDVFLGGHGSFFSLAEKKRRLDAGEAANPFLQAGEFRAFLDRAEQVFRQSCLAQGVRPD